MQVLTDGEVLRKLRKLRGLSQKECCHGIVSRHTYSRIERNQTNLQFQIFTELLERLNTSYADFLFLKKEKERLNIYRQKLSSLNKKNIQENDPLELYAYFEKNKNKSIQNFHYYLLCKKKMEKLDFDQIEKINMTDLNQLTMYINNLTFFSILDLNLISDMSDYLTYDTIKKGSLKAIKKLTYNNLTLAYQQAVHQFFYSITSVALKNEDYTFTKYLLKQTNNFLSFFPDHYFLLFSHVNRHTLNYKLSQNNYYLSKLFILKDCMKELKDEQSVKQIENQIKLLLQHSSSHPTPTTILH
ncbi:hypothetical protein A5821_000343 [Enterococcus sp. 7F3_DIV0205]|uniref:HTH cro/C1-type domain-containing protein n=1 Tax=Candidatus Enterococcus palustris TaxID=1834189 RepID=A0AAQ3W5M3_9ENTE|nr:helix-turn-helix transcriptional regulator [Enterococcus sp. 7F3_DIV0205]OTN84756.1 hypothetical protein A5821_000685 [Enterococcus sp. 7F3_DIV0205]